VHPCRNFDPEHLVVETRGTPNSRRPRVRRRRDPTFEWKFWAKCSKSNPLVARGEEPYLFRRRRIRVARKPGCVQRVLQVARREPGVPRNRVREQASGHFDVRQHDFIFQAHPRSPRRNSPKRASLRIASVALSLPLPAASYGHDMPSTKPSPALRLRAPLLRRLLSAPLGGAIDQSRSHRAVPMPSHAQHNTNPNSDRLARPAAPPFQDLISQHREDLDTSYIQGAHEAKAHLQCPTSTEARFPDHQCRWEGKSFATAQTQNLSSRRQRTKPRFPHHSGTRADAPTAPELVPESQPGGNANGQHHLNHLNVTAVKLRLSPKPATRRR
jgi:hypothetical protein